MALLGVWYNNFYAAETHAIMPYDQYLQYFSNYFQQSDMESNGKSRRVKNGHQTSYSTGPISKFFLADLEFKIFIRIIKYF